MADTVHDWDDVVDEVRRIVADSAEPIAPSTVAIAFDVLLALRDNFPVPQVCRGFWLTIRFCWAAWEIEVHSDVIEIYRFRDKETQIKHFDHTPGEPLSTELLEALALPSR